MREQVFGHEPVILIVDDQPSQVMLLAEAAKGLGVLHFASSGSQALELAAHLRPDVVLLDIEMPDMDGYRVCRTLKADPRLADAAVIFVSAHAHDTHELQALELGAVDFLYKPLNLPVARARIRTQVKLRSMARALATRDSLTGLPNRTGLAERAQLALEKARRGHSRVGLLLLNLDGFSTLNDAIGHEQADRLLQQVAQRLSSLVRSVDTLCRPGSDEFIILQSDVQHCEAIGRFAERLQGAMGEAFQVQSTPCHLTVSMGIALYPDDSRDFDSLLRHADSAMNQAKRDGRGRYRFYSRDIERAMRARHLLEYHLRRAVDERIFDVWYQAKYDAREQRFVGVEALIRWRDEHGRMVPPMDFIPLAEQTGLIIPIGLQVLRRACQDGRTWQDQGLDICVSVNISMVQFRDESFLSQVGSLLLETGLTPGRLELEITEGVLADGQDGPRQTLLGLQQLGVRISIDDFGTGYSSLAYLKRFPIDVLKIDQGFVRDMLSDRSDVAIIEAIVKLGKALELSLVAEGVEQVEQQEALQRLGCDVMQGYLYCRPAPFEQVTNLLTQGDPAGQLSAEPYLQSDG